MSKLSEQIADMVEKLEAARAHEAAIAETVRQQNIKLHEKYEAEFKQMHAALLEELEQLREWKRTACSRNPWMMNT